MARERKVLLEGDRSVTIRAMRIKEYIEYSRLMDRTIETRSLTTDPEMPDVKDPEVRSWRYFFQAMHICVCGWQGIDGADLMGELTPGEAYMIGKAAADLSHVREDERKNSTSSSPS